MLGVDCQVSLRLAEESTSSEGYEERISLVRCVAPRRQGALSRSLHMAKLWVIQTSPDCPARIVMSSPLGTDGYQEQSRAREHVTAFASFEPKLSGVLNYLQPS